MTPGVGTDEKSTKVPRRGPKKRASEYVKHLRAAKRKRERAKQKAERARQKEMHIRSLRELSRAALLAFALQDKQDELHELARRLIAEEQGQPWKSIRRAAQKQEPTKSLLPEPITSVAAPRKKASVKKAKLPTFKRVHGNKVTTLPPLRANLGNDYLKPMSKEYDMPEYDLE
jgi:hypothetical protein